MEALMEQPTFGPLTFDVNLRINPLEVPNGPIAVIDVETDEKDGFVGIGIMSDSSIVSYYSSLRPDLVTYLGNVQLIGHNLKGDAHWLKSWGVDIKPSNLIHDTMLKSYVRNSTKESHGLKELAKEFLHMEWPTYDQMVGEGKNKVTLDQQEIGRVAAYCGTDCVATYRLNEYLDRVMTPPQKGYYNQIELPTMQLLFAMEEKGVTVDVDYLRALKVDFQQDATKLLSDLLTLVHERGYVPPHVKSCPKKAHSHEFNPGSPKQVLGALNAFGFALSGTAKEDLEPHRGDEFINMLLEYRKINKVISTFLTAWLELPTLPTIHTTFSQVSFDDESGDWKGIRTGRLSSKEPNLQQISKAGDVDQETTGKALRSGFIPSSSDKELWVYDFDQFQYRILAHYTKEPVLLNAFKNGEDVHEATAKMLLGKTVVTKAERSLGKSLNFGAIFGAQAEKIAQVAKVSVKEAEGFLALYWKRLPAVTFWIQRTKMLAHVHKSVKTIFGRVIPLPDIDNQNRFEQMHVERTAVNYIIQGGEADIIKLGMLKVNEAGFMPILQVHDELHFEGRPENRGKDMPKIQSILENIVHLDVPIIANVGYGLTWFAAK